MRQALLLPAALLFAITLLVSPTLAQETTGRIEGRVLDNKGLPIADVSVTVTSPALQGGRGCMTTARGTFLLPALPVGEYRVKLQHLAYQTQVLEEVRVRLGQTTSMGDVRLGEKVLDQPEIVVSGKRPLIDPTSTEIGATLVTKEVDALPVDRDYRSLATLLPEVSLSFLGDPANYAGSTGYETRYLIDGVDVTDPFRSATGTSLPYNFVEEVEVRTGGYQAEYRSALGATVNAVTYSGGDRVTAQAFGFYTEGRPTADPRYAFKPNDGDYALYDVGAGVGGPILRDRLWYNAAYNPTITREDVEIPGQGWFEDNTVTHSFAGKLTWRANQSNTLVLSAIGDPSARDGVVGGWPNQSATAYAANPDPFLRDIRTGGIGLSLEGRHALRENLLLRSSLSWATHEDQNLPATERGRNELAFFDAETGTASGGASGWADNRAAVAIGGLSATWWLGAHELKVGADYKDTRYDFDFRSKDLTRYSETEWIMSDWAAQGRVGVRVASGFLQDSWRLGERVRLNAGVRWDGMFIVASDGDVAQSILDEWQPRLGFTWQPDRAGEQKVFGSLGRYYHDLALWPLFWYYNGNSHAVLTSYDHDPRVDPAGGDAWEAAPGAIQSEVSGMRGQYYDEFTLGYERRIGAQGKLGAKGLHRILREGLEDGQNPDSELWWFGNPGRGELSAFPRAEREYSALEISYRQDIGEQTSLLTSYVLSRTYGNYPGLFNSDFNYPVPNANGSFDVIESTVNSEGLLPNDRTHVFKLSGSYRARWGVTLGAVAAWESGTPLSEFGSGSWTPIFLRQRGTAGRTPSIWDLSLRLAYAPPLGKGARVRPQVTLDWLHIGSERQPVTYDQLRYRSGTDWEDQSDPNPFYGSPTQYQPPASVRVGVEARF